MLTIALAKSRCKTDAEREALQRKIEAGEPLHEILQELARRNILVRRSLTKRVSAQNFYEQIPMELNVEDVTRRGTFLRVCTRRI
jgi:hypothetical protein